MTTSTTQVEARPLPRSLKRIQIEDTSDVIDLVAAIEGGTCHVWGCLLCVNGATDLSFLSNETDISGPLGGGDSGGPFVLTLDPPVGRSTDDTAFPYFSGAEGEPLSLGNSAEVRVSGYVLVEQTG